ncbi:hypothetical protein HRbin26_00009 [bacterium HR26]|nr:hypothetical protein HRbin26_00009 [bacterium HR26]
MNAPVWLTWAAVATLGVAITRNPLYLSLALGATASVYLAVDRRRPLGRPPTRLPLQIGLAVALASVVFNALTAHVGDRVLWRLPSGWPIVGGPITLNAVLYGLLTATVLLTLLVVAAVLDGALDRAQALRLVPPTFSTAMTSLALALTAFPMAVRAVREVREAQQARGISGPPALRLRSILVPVLHRGLEHAFAVAETLECRGFGAENPSPWARRLMLAAVGGLCTLVLGMVTGDGRLAELGLLSALLALFLLFRGAWAGVRRLRWSREEMATLALALGGAAILLGTLALAPAELTYSTYPRLSWPPFHPVTGLAYLSLATPALLLLEERR